MRALGSVLPTPRASSLIAHAFPGHFSMGQRCIHCPHTRKPPKKIRVPENRVTTLSENYFSEMKTIISIALFIIAGLLEIGGGYLFWIWVKGNHKIWVGLLGGLLLILYGIIPTLQPAHFGRVYAAYGGVFVVLSILWGWKVDGFQPDRFDLIGAAITIVGVSVIMYWPRT
jgi:small multidrug resistance family-3 protein